MANVKISELPSVTVISANVDALPIDNNGVTKKATPTQIVVGSLDPYVKFVDSSSPVNQLTVTNADSGSSPSIAASGADTNINLTLLPKGTGSVVLPRTVVQSLNINDLTGGQFYEFVPSNLSASRQITLPLLTGNDTLVCQSHTQTLTNKTLGEFKVLDSVGDNYYTITPSSLTTNRVLYLPILTSDDTLVGEGTQCTLTNKTISGLSNTISNIGNSSLTNSSITINGSSVSLGGSISVGTGTVTSVAMTVPTGLSISGTPVTSSGTLALSFASGYSIPTNASQSNWDSAYTDRFKWDGGSAGLVAATGRTSLGLGTAATMTGPSGSIVGTTDVQTLTNKTLGEFKVLDSVGDNYYTVTPSSLTTNRALYLPILTSDDTLVGEGTQCTLTNKTISGLSNTISNIGNSSLTNSSITINGSSVSLGGSISVGTGTVTSVAMTVPTGLTVSGTPITSSGTFDVTLTAGYVIPTTTSTTNWDSAYADRLKWDGGSTGLVAATGRTSLGLGTAATMTGPSGSIVGTTDVQTLTNKTLGEFKVLDSVGDNYYTVTPSSLISNRVLYLPILTSDDTLVGEGTQCTLTNKTISGSSNTLSNIGNSSLTNSSITINGSAISLGGSVSVGTVTSVGGTGSVSGITLSGTITSTGNLTLGGSLNLSSPPAIGSTTPNSAKFSTVSATTSMGYSTGAGGAVTQTGSITSNITINKICGQITTVSSTFSSSSFVSFFVSNNTVGIDDTVIINLQSYTQENKYIINVVNVDVGSFYVQIFTPAAITSSESLILNFSVIKAVSS